MLNFLRSKFSYLDTHTKEVVKKASASTLIKVGGMLIGVGVSIFLGHAIGAEGIGIINLTERIIRLLIIICLLGSGKIIIKEIAIAFNIQNWKHIGNVMHSAYIINGGLSLVVSTVGIVLTPWVSENVFHEPRLTIPLIIALAVMPPQIFSRIFSSGLIGYRKIWQSNLVDQTLSVFVTGFLLLIYFIFKIELNINRVAILYAIGRIIVTISIGTYWRKLYSSKIKKRIIGRTILEASMPLLLSSLSLVVTNMADGIMLGWLRSPREVGLYSVAARIALLTSFFLQVTNAAISPKIAALFAEGKINEMAKMVQRITKGLSFIGVFPIIIFLFLGKFILSVWGTEFIGAYWILIILSVGQFFNIATGATGLVLIMCGFEKIQGRISFVFLIVNLFLNYFFIVNYGAIGAAIATAISVAGTNITKLIFVKIKVGVLTIPFFSNNKYF